jgi:hypothetical protein
MSCTRYPFKQYKGILYAVDAVDAVANKKNVRDE